MKGSPGQACILLTLPGLPTRFEKPLELLQGNDAPEEEDSQAQPVDDPNGHFPHEWAPPSVEEKPGESRGEINDHAADGQRRGKGGAEGAGQGSRQKKQKPQ